MAEYRPLQELIGDMQCYFNTIIEPYMTLDDHEINVEEFLDFLSKTYNLDDEYINLIEYDIRTDKNLYCIHDILWR